jgi:hypothetical protein
MKMNELIVGKKYALYNGRGVHHVDGPDGLYTEYSVNPTVIEIVAVNMTRSANHDAKRHNKGALVKYQDGQYKIIAPQDIVCEASRVTDTITANKWEKEKALLKEKVRKNPHLYRKYKGPFTHCVIDWLTRLHKTGYIGPNDEFFYSEALKDKKFDDKLTLIADTHREWYKKVHLNGANWSYAA